MELSFKIVAICIPLVFLAGFVDAIGGGGGLISLPAYLFAGLPTHMAIATNKLSSACGTSLATAKFIKEKLVDFKLAIPTILCAFGGAAIGARLSLGMDEAVLQIILVPVLIVAAFFVLNKKLFGKEVPKTTNIPLRTYLISALASFVIGMYDGFYGPGTGTFLIIALNVFGRLGLSQSNAQAKVINLTTNITSLAVFIMGGQVWWTLGIMAAAANTLGAFFGVRLALKKGEKITRPVIISVLVLLALKIFVFK